MSVFQRGLELGPLPRGLHEITASVRAIVRDAGVQAGLCNVFVHHTSASLIIQENADPDVALDLEDYLRRLAPDGDPRYRHQMEGPDDLSAHIATTLTGVSLVVPVVAGALALGRWQGIFLWEHRASAGPRRLTVTVLA